MGGEGQLTAEQMREVGTGTEANAGGWGCEIVAEGRDRGLKQTF